MLTSINITGLTTYGYHGLFEEERTLGQKFTFDISAVLREVATHRGDDLDSSIRYDVVVDEVVQIAASDKFRTLEALGETIAIGLLRRFAAFGERDGRRRQVQSADCARDRTGRRRGRRATRRACRGVRFCA
jgi:FolB domain-containing protein